MSDKEYLKEKRIKMLEAIKPICEAFKIKDYDYLIEDNHEILKLGNVKIDCDSNSEYTVISELVGYLFIQHWKDRYMPHEKETFIRIKEYWIK